MTQIAPKAIEPVFNKLGLGLLALTAILGAKAAASGQRSLQFNDCCLPLQDILNKEIAHAARKNQPETRTSGLWQRALKP